MAKFVREWGIVILQTLSAIGSCISDDRTEQVVMILCIICLQIISELWDLKDNYLS